MIDRGRDYYGPQGRLSCCSGVIVNRREKAVNSRIQGFNGNSKSKADALQQMFELRDVIWEEKLEEDANEDQIRLLSDT